MTDEQRPRKIRALVTNDMVHYPHNDLAAGAAYIRERIILSDEDHGRSAYTYVDVLALVVLAAFSLEGYVTFVGDRLIKCQEQSLIRDLAWKTFDRMGTQDKLKEVLKLTGSSVDWNKRPYKTVKELKEIRDLLAHPKPCRPEKIEYETTGTEEEIRNSLRDYIPKYAKGLTVEFASIVQSDVECIWLALLDAANIPYHETWCGGSQGIEFLGEAD